jgi:hypothetical protein
VQNADAGASLVTSLAVDGVGRVHATGDLGGETVIADLAASGALLPSVVAASNDAGTGVSGRSLAVDSLQSVWVAGSYGANMTLGRLFADGAVPEYAGVPRSVFVARIDPGGP